MITTETKIINEEVVSEEKNRQIELRADEVSREPIDITSIVKIEDVIEENPLNPTPSSLLETCILTSFHSFTSFFNSFFSSSLKFK
jgi:hypothetical protein